MQAIAEQGPGTGAALLDPFPGASFELAVVVQSPNHLPDLFPLLLSIYESKGR